MSITVTETKYIKDLTDNELLEELESVEDSIAAEYRILANMKSAKKEILDEILKRFGGVE